MKIKVAGLYPLLLCMLLFYTSCNLPKDQKSSWEKATTQGLKVGVIENPPFTSKTDNSFSGSEIDIVNSFASANNLQVSYHGGNESDLIEKLEKYELDILIGGFDKKSVWSKKAGFTRAYDKKHVLLVPKGENKLLVKLEEFIHKNLENEKS